MTEATITERIQAEMVKAMKEKDAETLSTVRMLEAALMEAKTARPKDAVLTREREIAVTQRFLPAMLSEDKLKEIVKAAVASTGAAGPKDMGKVIGAVMAQVKGQAEGGTVSRLVKQALGG